MSLCIHLHLDTSKHLHLDTSTHIHTHTHTQGANVCRDRHTYGVQTYTHMQIHTVLYTRHTTHTAFLFLSHTHMPGELSSLLRVHNMAKLGPGEKHGKRGWENGLCLRLLRNHNLNNPWIFNLARVQSSDLALDWDARWHGEERRCQARL